MNPTHDEYEEVESPFASSTSQKTPYRERLRSRKNVFNRPFAADSSNAPTYVETTATRRSVGQPEQTEMLGRRSNALAEAEIDYLEDEDEVQEEVEKLPARRTSPTTKKKVKTQKNIFVKMGWALVGVLVLRLILMDRGVWDYFSTEGVIQEKQEELASIRMENKELKAEITRIQVDKGYQKQLAKEHLGVVAADEFLILFAGENPEETPDNNSL
jgi:cell division protein FtsB